MDAEFIPLLVVLGGGLLLGIMGLLFRRPPMAVHVVPSPLSPRWVPLPGGMIEEQPSRRYGFLIEPVVSNRGETPVLFSSCRLRIPLERGGHLDMPPQPLPELPHPKPQPFIEDPDAPLLVPADTVRGGILHFIAEFYGEEGFNPVIKGTTIPGILLLDTGDGKTIRHPVRFLYRDALPPLCTPRGCAEGIRDREDENRADPRTASRAVRPRRR